MINEISALGFNTIRIPFSSENIRNTGITNLNVNYNANPALKGLNSIQALDYAVAYMASLDPPMHFILDHHSCQSDNFVNENRWYTTVCSEAQWIADWEFLAARYVDNLSFLGCDIHNEPRGADSATGSLWGSGNSLNDWSIAATKAANAILAVNPNLLIFVEGNEFYEGVYNWWGGNAIGHKLYPIVTTVANRVVISPHDYGPLVYNQPW